MQARLGRDPYEALGLNNSSTQGDVRTAFLTLSKKFHPQKFARMPQEIQRLATEVFLSLRAAHDSIAKAAAPTRKSGPLPVAKTGTGQVPVVSRTSPSGPVPQPTAPLASSSQAMRPFTSPRPAQPVGPAQPAKPPVTAPPAKPAAPTAPAASAPKDPVRELASIVDLIKVGQLPAARAALESLIAQAPNESRYQAMLFVVQGGEAQLANKPEEARRAFLDAQRIDPELELAKTALTRLMLRRK